MGHSIIVFFVTVFCLQAHAVLPPEAQTYLNQLPEKKLTLSLVVQQAIGHADSYRLVGLDYATAHIEEQATIDPQTDTYLQAGGSYADDNSAKTNPFNPLRAKRWEWNVGLSKNWSSGTSTSVGWIYDTNRLQFDNSLGAFSNSFISEYKQSTAQVQLEQKLLKDSFGYSFRKRRKATRKRAEAIQWKTRDDLESLTIEMINTYYQAWLMQEQVTSVQDQVKRQERLVRIMTDRSKKGAVEKPDLIQMQALLAASRTRLTGVHSDLSNIWEQLVVSLKLPKSFLNVDPMDVPTAIDNPVPLGLRVCGQKEPSKTAAVHALEKQLEGLNADYKAAESDLLPDLKLLAGYRGNSIDGEASTTVRNVLRGRDDVGYGRGPAWNVGVQLNWPLSNSAARAQRAQKYVEREKVSSRLQMAVDNVKTQWRDTCRRLQAEYKNEQTFEKVVIQQKSRLKAEEKRFRLGRIRVDQLVTAEDDLGQWEFQSQQKAVEVRLLAWKVQKLSGELYRSIAPQVEKALDEASL